MRTVVILICSLSLVLFNASGAEETQGGKGKRKATPGQAQPGRPAAKPVQTGKPTGAPGKPAESRHAHQTVSGTNERTKGPGAPQTYAKPAEVGKAKAQPHVGNANKPAEIGKAKGAGKGKATGEAATAGQPGGPKPSKVGKPGKAGVAAGKPFKPQHINVPKQPNTAKAPPVKFQQGRHIQGSEHWQGQQYAVFRNYHSEWHDQNWWHNHYHNNFVFVFGAPYFFNAGYWYPAWGYSANAYYAWDGPIYAYNHMPPDQVIANVQTALQQQGYYHGEVDGSIGPLTRAAIAAYQRDHGLYETAAIDRPTLESLGMS
jgi:hypothetical protein